MVIFLASSSSSSSSIFDSFLVIIDLRLLNGWQQAPDKVHKFADSGYQEQEEGDGEVPQEGCGRSPRQILRRQRLRPGWVSLLLIFLASPSSFYVIEVKLM